MNLSEAKARLYDTTFLIGTFRRRAALRELAGSTDPAGAVALAEALGKGGHPNQNHIAHALLQLSAERDADKVRALWDAWARSPTAPVAAVLGRLGWPPSHAVDASAARAVLAVARADSPAEILQAVSGFTPMLKALVIAPDTEGALVLAEFLGKGHPNARDLSEALLQLSAERDAEKVRALWDAWARSPTAPVAAVLGRLGWPPSHAVDGRFARDVLGFATVDAAPQVRAAVAALARALPVADEATNDAIYGAWVRSQSADLEKLIAEQGRQPGSPALEALHALVTGRLERYAALDDEDGMLVVQAFAMAPEPFRERLARAVAASPDRRLKEAYRRALTGGSGVDAASSLDNLKRVGDEDGLFELARSLRLAEALDLCERWAASNARPSAPRQRAAVERALTAYRRLGDFKVEAGPELPEGLVDIFDWWRREKPGDAELRADLDAADPFRRARGLYLGHERGLVDATRLGAAARSEHWPERLIARLADTALYAEKAEDHVLWVAACAGDGTLLNEPIGGTPEDYARNTERLGKARGAAAVRSQALLEILCALQGVFVSSGITVEKSGEATDRRAVEIEDAPEGDF
ncbi:hypothetical protein [Accumulibacter sp.]|uniref:hypothetical protein n=1 Tax=Accumulibacter sp. TaxID=2053492 RepID=UPI0025CEF58C|nr:hypothetical protein [Accumulibacter sp.]MCM8626293.1 hypothetical protein [Accumulibacter sp.]